VSRPRRVLYYNWVDYLDAETRGGGVSVYQRNLMTALAGAPQIEAIFLSSGLSFDLWGRGPRWEQVCHGPDRDRDRRYEIVNSGVQAPAHHSFGDPAQIDHPETAGVFFDFIKETGPYDVVHFNNIEGLPVSVLELKKRWPETRIILSLHNYYPICPQVNLWHLERISCVDFDQGRKCVHCLPHQPDPRIVRLANVLAYRLKRLGLTPGKWAFDTAFRWTLRIIGRGTRLIRRGTAYAKGRAKHQSGRLEAVTVPDGRGFAARREAMITAINTHCDAVLCVSDAVRRLAESYGIDPARTHTSYIGTQEADAFEHTRPRGGLPGHDGVLTLGYLGYMRRDKGFFFLLQALETMPADLAGRLRLVVAARRGGRSTMNRLMALAPKLAGLEYADGYHHDNLDTLLAGVDVGVIPVLWHDNLPQVAIEMHARHIPLLTSDMGGAKEMGNCADMVFSAGDDVAFHARIKNILEGGADIDAYWRAARTPVNMARHLDELLQHYGLSGHAVCQNGEAEQNHEA
jgi:hypothetical protein